jgi:hypothetical protein
MILSFSGSRKVKVANKWFSLSYYFRLWFFYGKIKEEIRFYKDLKFIILRLIHDY